jgi:hypothetical protein
VGKAKEQISVKSSPSTFPICLPVYSDPPIALNHLVMNKQSILLHLAEGQKVSCVQFVCLFHSAPEVPVIEMKPNASPCAAIGWMISSIARKRGTPSPVVIVYVGNRHEEFARRFARFGLVTPPFAS